MKKNNYLVRRTISASIDILTFALIFKILEPFISHRDADGQDYTNTGFAFILFYVVLIGQDILMNKTIGKYLMKLEMNFEDSESIKIRNRYLRIIMRRSFDLIELVCPFIYLGFIISTKKNQKLGDIISKIVIQKKD